MENFIDYMNITLSAEDRAKLLLDKMSIDEKMGQVVCYFPIKPGDYDGLNDYQYGAGHVSTLQMRMLDTLEDCSRFQSDIQQRNMDKSPHNIPAIFHMEGLCGALIQEATSFPSGIGRGASWDPELEEEIGRIVGRQERAVGITQTFAPVLDINRDPRMGRQGESYGEDPTLVSAMGVSFVKGIQEQGSNGQQLGKKSEEANNTRVLKSDAVAKHFLGSHQAEGGIHAAHSDISDHMLREVYGKPFQAVISKAGIKGIMPCYNSIGNEPVSVSKKIQTTLLREEMGFEGITVSDYCAMSNVYDAHKVCESYTEVGLRAMDAGMDSELQYKKCFNDELGEWFRSGKADVAILDKAVLRILTAKFRMGLFENPFALSGTELKHNFHNENDIAVSLCSACESLVLVKNNGVLPLPKRIKRLAVIGCHAFTARFFFGGYTHFSMAEGCLAVLGTMAGIAGDSTVIREEIKTYPGTCIQVDEEQFEELLTKQKPGIMSLLEQLKASLPDTEVMYSYGYPFAGTDTSGHDDALKMAEDADYVILTLGGKHGSGSIASMGEGADSADINLPFCQESFIEKLAALNKPVAAVHFNGRPISSDAADRHIGAILEAWNPSEMGALAITDALLGNYNPGGKLPVSVAYHTGQIPVYYSQPNGSGKNQSASIAFPDYVDLPHRPRYCFGHGLSYTVFEYSNLNLDITELDPEMQISISADIDNIGDVPGDEVVQLYIKDRYASMVRPAMDLAGFKRVSLLPGEKTKVTFILKASQLAFLDKEMRWKIEKGDIDVYIGASSDDIRLQSSFFVTKDMYVDGRTREFFTTTDVNIPI